MKTKIQIKTFYGSLLFEFEKEDNTIKETLSEAVRNRANLREADLRGANLRGANLQGAYLQGADLQGADLQGAYLQGADLQGADLQGAYLQGAYLRGAYLRGAYLQGAYLQGAYLQGAYLQGAYLQGAYLQNIYKHNTILPEGELIVWKKLQNNYVAKLQIPTKAKRTQAIGSRKCRFEFAKVLAIYDGKKQVDSGKSIKNDLLYEKNSIVRPDSFDKSPLIECSNGIHAFITRIEAEEFNM